MKQVTVTFTGIRAAYVEEAEHASFYGIHGDNYRCARARQSCLQEAKERLNLLGIKWNEILILSAHSIDTTGTKTPYKAEMTFRYTPA